MDLKSFLWYVIQLNFLAMILVQAAPPGPDPPERPDHDMAWMKNITGNYMKIKCVEQYMSIKLYEGFGPICHCKEGFFPHQTNKYNIYCSDSPQPEWPRKNTRRAGAWTMNIKGQPTFIQCNQQNMVIQKHPDINICLCRQGFCMKNQTNIMDAETKSCQLCPTESPINPSNIPNSSSNSNNSSNGSTVSAKHSRGEARRIAIIVLTIIALLSVLLVFCVWWNRKSKQPTTSGNLPIELHDLGNREEQIQFMSPSEDSSNQLNQTGSDP